MNSTDIARANREKGFWSPDSEPIDYKTAKTSRQLNHLDDEVREIMYAPSADQATEEVADFVIVAADLLGQHGYVVILEDVPAKPFMPEYANYADWKGKLSRAYRKTGVIDDAILLDGIASMYNDFGKDAVLAAVSAKLAVNATRPTAYGVANGNAVDHPSHYNQGGIECIDAIKAALTPEEFAGFCKGNAIKYVWRAGHKCKPTEDLRKGRYYLGYLTESA